MKKAVIIVVVILALGGALWAGIVMRDPIIQPTKTTVDVFEPTQQDPTARPTPTEVPIPLTKILPSDYQVFQSFNNCGPAALSMTLRYYGIVKSQEELGQALRPWQNAIGDNDDKSVTLQELGQKATEYGFIAYHRPNGNIEVLKRFIAADMPVITRTWVHPNEDIGHYRVVNGYDDTAKVLIQQDSMEGKDLRYSYDVFNEIWKNNNFEYLVLVPQDKKEIAENILGADRDEAAAWRSALTNAQNLLAQNPDDVYAGFNASIAYFHLNDYAASVKEFERVESRLAWRTLWYQIEPIQAYEKLGNHDRVFQLTDQILNNQNRSFSELYILRGDIYKKQGNAGLARAEYERAVYYNQNLKVAHNALASL